MGLIPQWARDLMGRAADSVARTLRRRRVSSTLTATVGLLTATSAAFAFATGRARLAGLLVLVGGMLEALSDRLGMPGGGDPQLARFRDATLARVAEATALSGVALYFVLRGLPDVRQTVGVLAAVAAMGTALLASSTSDRLLDLGVGARERQGVIAGPAERLLLLGVPPLLLGAGDRGWVLIGVTASLTFLNTIAVVQRVTSAARTATGSARRPARGRDTLPGHRPAAHKGPAG
jgi:hypothetical protein